jgi:Skp family chaperone for outer membrane proteins
MSLRAVTRRAWGRWLIALIALIAAIMMVTAAPAVADVTTSCEFLEISAKQGSAPAIDAELKPVEKKLKKPPFSTWNQFKLLAHAQKSLAKKKPESIGLRIGSATATLIEIVDKSKVRLTVTMEDEKGKQVANNTTTVEAGDHVIFVHELPNNEGHLLSLTCR